MAWLDGAEFRKNVLYVLGLVLQTDHTETEFALDQGHSPALICLILEKFHLGGIFCLTSYHVSPARQRNSTDQLVGPKFADLWGPLQNWFESIVSH